MYELFPFPFFVFVSRKIATEKKMLKENNIISQVDTTKRIIIINAARTGS